MKFFAKLLPAMAAALALTGCEVTVSDDSEPVKLVYDYKYLTYCEIYDDGYADCEDMGTAKIQLYGVMEKGERISVDTYLGTAKGYVNDTYIYEGTGSDEIGSYKLFYTVNQTDRLRLYEGRGFAVMRAWNDSYYWSFSNEEDLYKKNSK